MGRLTYMYRNFTEQGESTYVWQRVSSDKNNNNNNEKTTQILHLLLVNEVNELEPKQKK